jgi:type II secretory pathway pseudopilin PulG
MEDVLVWLFWAAIIGGSIASSVSKAKKKRAEEEARQAQLAQTQAQLAQARQAQARPAQGGETYSDDGGYVRDGSYSGAGGHVGGHAGARGYSPHNEDGYDSGRATGTAAGGGVLGKLFDEITQQLGEQQLPPVAWRPINSETGSRAWDQAEGQPAATSYDYYSLEDEDDMGYDGRYEGGELGSPGGELQGSFGGEFGSRGGEFGSRSQRGSFGGEFGSRGGEYGSRVSDLHSGGTKGSAVRADRFEAEIAAYEQLAAKRTRQSIPAAAASTSATASARVSTTSVPASAAPGAAAAIDIEAMADLSAPEGDSATLRDLLGGDFDLRRAVIESEILTPKYV